MEQKKSTLKKIKATVMPQTAEGLQMLMEETGLTIGEVIDRLTLQMCPDDLGLVVSRFFRTLVCKLWHE